VSGLDGLADVVWDGGRWGCGCEGKGKDDAEAMSILSGKNLELPDCFEIAGNHVHCPSFAAKAGAPGKKEQELEPSAPASGSIYPVNPPSNPMSLLSR
jgi:hypothetical protein